MYCYNTYWIDRSSPSHLALQPTSHGTARGLTHRQGTASSNTENDILRPDRTRTRTSIVIITDTTTYCGKGPRARALSSACSRSLSLSLSRRGAEAERRRRMLKKRTRTDARTSAALSGIIKRAIEHRTTGSQPASHHHRPRDGAGTGAGK